MRIFVDMDGTLAKWNNVEFEQLYEKGYYRNLEPNRNIVDEVNSLISQKEDIYILSCYLADSKFALKEKIEWCKEFLPNLSEDKYIFVPFGTSKAKVFDERGLSPITNHDYLIDDYTKNLLEWKEMGGIGVKYLNGINHTKGTWQGLRINEKSAFSTKDTSLMALVLGEKLKSEYGIDLITAFENETQDMMCVCIYNSDCYYISVPFEIHHQPFSFGFSCDDLSSYIIHDIENQKTISFLPSDFKYATNQYYSRHYPTLSQCTDFHLLIEHCNSNTLDDMEYTLYLYENTKAITFNNDGMCFNKGYEYLEGNSRISFNYIDWYENIIETKDLINEVQLESNNEMVELEEPDICDDD